MPVERIGLDVQISPGGALDGTVRVPGSKSITQRMLICSALTDGASILHGALLADDTRIMLQGLERLGIATCVDAECQRIEIQGCGGQPWAEEAQLDVGPAGTAMRFLTALACLGHGRRRIDGSERMRCRPIALLVEALHDLGARIRYERESGYPPLSIAADGLAGGETTLASPPSSQYLSAILMVAPYAARDVMIRIDGPLPSRPYVDLTIDAMRTMGVELLDANGRFIVPSAQRYTAGVFSIEPDASSAAYFFAAAAVTGGRVRVPDITAGSLQGDAGFVDILEQMGCRIERGSDYLEVIGPEKLTGVSVDLNSMPDTVQTLAVAALFADGPTEIRNVANLRIKETDRLAALAAELARMDAKIDLYDDGLKIHPPAQVPTSEIQTYDDHRMAMSFAVAGLAAPGVLIKDADCVSKSFPRFFDVLDSIPFRG